MNTAGLVSDVGISFWIFCMVLLADHFTSNMLYGTFRGANGLTEQVTSFAPLNLSEIREKVFSIYNIFSNVITNYRPTFLALGYQARSQ